MADRQPKKAATRPHETPLDGTAAIASRDRLGLDPMFWRVGAALALLMFATSLMNSVVFPLFDPIFTYARDISITANAGILMIVGAIATFRPRWLHPRTFDIAFGIALVVGSVLLIPALQIGDPALLIISSSLAAIGRAGAIVMVGLAAARFDARQASLCVSLAFATAFVFELVSWVLPVGVDVVLFLVLPLIAFGITFQKAQLLLEATAEAEAPADVAITRPSTFLPLASQLFVCIFLFRMAFGYSLRFGETGGVPVSDLFVLVPVAVVAFFLWTSKRALNCDLTAQLSVVMVVAGFFLVASYSSNLVLASNVLLSAGNTFFDMMAWVVLISLAARNRAGALAAFAWGRGISGFGTLVGAALGVWSNTLFSSNRDLLTVVSGLLIVLFVGYALIGLKNFSFRDTIQGVKETAEEQQVATNPEEEFDARCAEVAQEYGLSPREEEVMKMLARGRDRAYIEEKLVVSRNTVKAHVKHVYAKLDIHSHQDLIALVQGD